MAQLAPTHSQSAALHNLQGKQITKTRAVK